LNKVDGADSEYVVKKIVKKLRRRKFIKRPRRKKIKNMLKLTRKKLSQRCSAISWQDFEGD
jgi:hypothetical protein